MVLRPPDVAALSCVGVRCVDTSNGANRRAVLRHVQTVANLGELRRLISIKNHDSHCCLVLKRTFL